MRIIYAERGAGKTQGVIDWFMESPDTRFVIVQNHTLRNDFMRCAKVRSATARVLVTGKHATWNLRRGAPSEIAIDDIDVMFGPNKPLNILEELANAAVWPHRVVLATVTISGSDNEEPLSEVRNWHMAHCVECTMPTMPFADVGQRDEWAEAHSSGTGHTVRRYEDRQGWYMRRGVQRGQEG